MLPLCSGNATLDPEDKPEIHLPQGPPLESPISKILTLKEHPEGAGITPALLPEEPKPQGGAGVQNHPSVGMPGTLRDDGEEKETAQGAGQPIPHPPDGFFRSCPAFPENTNFIIDFCSFVIFITWPAFLLRAVTNSTSPG